MKLIYEAKVKIELDLAKAGITDEEVKKRVEEDGIKGLSKQLECSLAESFCPSLPKEVEEFNVTTTILDLR